MGLNEILALIGKVPDGIVMALLVGALLLRQHKSGPVPTAPDARWDDAEARINSLEKASALHDWRIAALEKKSEGK